MFFGTDVAPWEEVAVSGAMSEVETPLALRHVAAATTITLPRNDDRADGANRLQGVLCHYTLLEVNKVEAVLVLLLLFIPPSDPEDCGWSTYSGVLLRFC